MSYVCLLVRVEPKGRVEEEQVELSPPSPLLPSQLDLKYHFTTYEHEQINTLSRSGSRCYS